MRKLFLITTLALNLSCCVWAKDNLCEGDRVTTDDHYNGVVRQIFPDGLVRVQIGDTVYGYRLSQLAKPIRCLKNICVGNTVTTDDHYTAKVEQVFPDELVFVVIGSTKYNYQAGQLAKPIQCLRDICQGNTVTTDDHYTGTVQQVFPDGLARVTIGSTGYDYLYTQLRNYQRCESSGSNCR